MTATPQIPLFTPRGNPNTPDLMRRDLRIRVSEAMAQVYGEHVADDCVCPHCDDEALRIVPHWTHPFAYCPGCSLVYDIHSQELSL